MRETELAEKFIQYFSEGYEIFKEVPSSGIIDFVARSGKTLIAVEVKTRLSFEVIEQAQKNRFSCDYSFIAVPHPKRTHYGYTICSMLGIGVLTYHEKYNSVYEQVKAKPQKVPHYMRPVLQEFMKKSVAGSQNDRQTAFKNTINAMSTYIKRHPGCTLKECLSNVNYHWSNMSSAKGCVYRWIKEGVIKDFRLEDGRLFLTEAA